MKNVVSDFRGVAILDSDGVERADDISDALAITYWKHYEAENTFITPDSILRFIEARFDEEEELFVLACRDAMREVLDGYLRREVFESDDGQLREYWNASANLRRTLLRNIKMSALADSVFEAFAEKQGQPPLLRKGEYYRLVEFASPEDIPDDVTRKLDLLVERLAGEEEASV